MSTKHLIDSQYRQLHASLSKSPTPAQALEERHLRRMGAAWECLLSCSQIDEVDMAQGPGRVLADAAIAIIDEPQTRQAALAELAMMALTSDRPALWAFSRLHGFDPQADDGLHTISWGRSRLDEKPSSWICKAIHLRAWACVEMLAHSPDGRVGLPGLPPPLRVGGPRLESPKAPSPLRGPPRPRPSR